MSKRLLWALILIAACVLIFVANAGDDISVRLVPGIKLAIHGMGALVYMGFVIIGIVIGVLIK